MPDYGEIFCDAVQEIVSKELAGLSYDFTQLCEIIDITDRDQGIYRVKTGQATFRAYSSITTYEVGDVVYVVTPNNDINQQRLIVAKKASGQQQPITYIAPFNNMTIASENLINASRGKYLVANNKDVSEVLIWSSSASDNLYAGYSRLGIQAEFKSQVNAIKGNYGIKILLYSGDRLSPVASLFLDSDDMYGNPYAYEGYYKQQKIFDISELPAFTKIEVYFYQNNNFVDKDNNNIPYLDDFGNLVSPNLFMANPEIYLGYDINDVYNKGLILYTADSVYFNDANTKRTIQWRFIRTLNNKQTELINDMSKLPGYSLYLFRYKTDIPVNIFAGANWSPILNDDGDYLQNFDKYIFTPDSSVEEYQYKAVIVYNNQPIYESNILTFKNTLDLVQAKVEKLMDSFQIYCEDNSDGIYNLYNQGNVVSKKSSATKTRKLSPKFIDSNNILTTIANVDRVKWIVPAKNTMINLKYDKDYRDLSMANLETDSQIEEYIMSLINADLDKGDSYQSYYKYKDYFYVYFIFPSKEDGSDQRISYKINSDLIPAYTNNTITCEITYENLKPIARKEFFFNTLVNENHKAVINFENGDSGFALNETGEKSQKKVILNFYDPDGNEITDYDRITWSWYKYDSVDGNENNFTQFFDIIDKDKNDNFIYLQLKEGITSVSDNYNILQAEVSYKDFNFTALLPIALYEASCEALEGPTEIVQTETGQAITNNSPYRLLDFSIDIGKKQEITYTLDSTYDKDTQEDRYKPSISEMNTLQVLSTSVSNLDALYCVNAKVNNRIYWSQPIVSISNNIANTSQGQNSIKPLNVSNDISTFSTEGNGYEIVSSTVSAGKVGDNQSYSGVVLGKVGKQGANPLFGLYGFKDNDLTFSLEEDGNATFKGTMTAGSGNIGGWIITDEGLTSPSGTLELKPAIKGGKDGIQIGSLFITEDTLIGNSGTIEGVDISATLVSLKDTDKTLQQKINEIDDALDKVEDEIFKDGAAVVDPSWQDITYISGIQYDDTTNSLTISQSKLRVLTNGASIQNLGDQIIQLPTNETNNT